MGFPKQVKKQIQLVPPKTLSARREQLLEYINKDGTYLPKSVLHADLDKGMLEFVKEELRTVVTGKVVPTVDILITTQNWSQFTETWNFVDLDKNVSPPFISVIRAPEIKYGSNPSLLYTIPNRRQYFYAQVPTWDGQRHGADVYKIPQPVPVDISYQVKIVCNRMRELNQFNKNILEMFASRQAYTVIKGHYIPIVMGNISDESVMDITKRKYYVQSYEFTMLGFLIDENEFEVSPAVSRILQVVEFDTTSRVKQKKIGIDNKSVDMDILFVVGNNIITEIFEYTTNSSITSTDNVDTYDVFINNDYYGSDITEIQINTNDVVRFVVTKKDNTQEANIKLRNLLI